ncbi:MAG: hypothetical protein ACRECN_07205, partial [Methylocella sp.]
GEDHADRSSQPNHAGLSFDRARPSGAIRGAGHFEALLFEMCLSGGNMSIFSKNTRLYAPIVRLAQSARKTWRGRGRVEVYIIARNISGPRLRCEALMVDKKTFTPWPPVTEDGWRRAYKFRDRLMAEVVRLELDPLGEELKVIEAVYIR